MRRVMMWTLALGLASGVAVPAAQSRAPEQSRAASDVALDGYCPVAYVEMNQAMKGNPAHASTHEGKRYHFANADAKRMFDQSPEKYLAAYDGWCASAVAMNMKLESDPELFTIHDGRTYLFSDAEAKAMFDKDTAGTIAKANANWPRLARQS